MNYATTDQWQTGFNAQVTIGNPSSTAINGWRLTWTFGGNQRIANLWNGAYTQSGAAVTVTNAAYNATIAAGSQVSFGFGATYSGSNPAPDEFRAQRGGLHDEWDNAAAAARATDTARRHRPPPPPPPPPPTAACTVHYAVGSAWSDGFTADVTIVNRTGAALTNWNVGWSFPGNQRVTNLWNGIATQTGQSVKVDQRRVERQRRQRRHAGLRFPGSIQRRESGAVRHHAERHRLHADLTKDGAPYLDFLTAFTEGSKALPVPSCRTASSPTRSRSPPCWPQRAWLAAHFRRQQSRCRSPASRRQAGPGT